jgi:hypothetical protein
MSNFEEEFPVKSPSHGGGSRQPLVVRVTDHDFQQDVLEKLSRLETKMDMLVGSAQPGRMQLAEERLVALERSEIKRGVYERLVNAVITVAISLVIALHDRWWK